MAIAQKITQKITLPQGLIDSLKVDLTGLEAFSGKIKDSLKNPDNTVTQTIEMILAGGIAFGSSDVHIEGRENDAKLRVRLGKIAFGNET